MITTTPYSSLFRPIPNGAQSYPVAPGKQGVSQVGSTAQAASRQGRQESLNISVKSEVTYANFLARMPEVFKNLSKQDSANADSLQTYIKDLAQIINSRNR
jgi:hypothetical protein